MAAKTTRKSPVPRKAPAASRPPGDEPRRLPSVPMPSARTFLRHGARAATACGVVGILAVVATWHAEGRVRSGEIERMLRTGAPRAVTAEARVFRQRLDKDAMKALVSSTAR